VRYAGDDLDTWESQVRPLMPAWLVNDLRIMYRFFQDHGFRATPEEVSQAGRLLRRPPRRFEDFAAETARAWMHAAVEAH
jgi:hypothetical protein